MCRFLAGAEREFDSAAGPDVDAGDVLGEYRWVAQVVVHHETRRVDVAAGDRCHGDCGRQVPEQMIRDQQSVVADLLRAPGPGGPESSPTTD